MHVSATDSRYVFLVCTRLWGSRRIARGQRLNNVPGPRYRVRALHGTYFLMDLFFIIYKVRTPPLFQTGATRHVDLRGALSAKNVQTVVGIGSGVRSTTFVSHSRRPPAGFGGYNRARRCNSVFNHVAVARYVVTVFSRLKFWARARALPLPPMLPASEHRSRLWLLRRCCNVSSVEQVAAPGPVNFVINLLSVH